jgi:hypothetical protein
MRNAGHAIFVAIGAVFATSIGNGAATQPRLCVYPDPHTLVARDVTPEIVAYRLFDTKAGPTRWLFLSWNNPSEDGMVFVLACDGHVVAKQRVGYIRGHDWGGPPDPRTGPGTQVDVTTSVATPTPDHRNSIITQSDTWLQFDGKTIAVLWTHATFVTHIGNGPGSTADTYEEDFLPPQNEIHVLGKRRMVLDEDAKPVSLPEERYCYRAALNRYVRC